MHTIRQRIQQGVGTWSGRSGVRWLLVGCVFAVLMWGATATAQFRGRNRGRSFDRSQFPTWEVDEDFQGDTFTFARIQFDSRQGGGWANDYPDCDINFSFRLQQLTSMNVDPNGIVMRLTDPNLFDYPFIFMSNVQGMSLSSAEAEALGKYLTNGGFLMADDFWTPSAWRHVQREMARALPNCKPRELTLDHEIFHLVYDFQQMPRVLSIKAWERGLDYEDWHGSYEGQGTDPHFQGYFDPSGRLMAIFCHNSDVGDGWEREGENHEFFENFSVKVSYPLGINIVTYAMTH